MQVAFYFDQSACTRCCACVVACKDWHDVPAGPKSFVHIKTVEKGVFPQVSVHHVFLSCFHCAQPACVDACPVSAITKSPTDGIVRVDSQACLGQDKCEMCLEVCPYDAPQFGSEPNAKMDKCDYCADRLAQGKQPVCVGACPMYALDASPLEELRTKYGDLCEAEGFLFSDKVLPSVLMRPRKDTRDLSVQRTIVTPPTAKAAVASH